MMRTRHLPMFATLTLFAITQSSLGQGDPEVVARIIEEGKNNSQVWSHLEYISHEIGPRLTGSTNAQEANDWTASKFNEWGLSNVHLHEWGTIAMRFDRGPSSAKIIASRPTAIEDENPPDPVERELEFTAPSWSPGTNGPVTGVIIKEPKSLDEVAALEGQLAGAWILVEPRGRGRRGVSTPGSTPELRDEIAAALREAGIAGRIVGSTGELVLTGGQRGWRDMTFENLETDVTVNIRRSDYDAINSRMADGEIVKAEINLAHTFGEGPIPVYNTVAEIPGTEKPDEVVIVSAHLDSWDGPGSMGTQDNGTGSSVTLEAARLLMAAGAQPKRTIRFILWTGEEQGLLGSRGYVESLSEEERAKISVCFVDDGGTNFQGGLACIASMEPMLTQATAPETAALPEMPVVIRVTETFQQHSGSDHAAFNGVGIPGFFWDESGSGGREDKDYRFIHHTQHDTPRYAVPEYLVQSAVCSAVTAYNIACADALLPREEPEIEVAEPTEEAAIPAASNSPISGLWNARTTGEFEFPFSLILDLSSEGVVTGQTRSEYGERTINGGSFNRETGEVTWTAEGSSMGPATYTATLNGETMSGRFSVGDMNMNFTATRESQPAAPPPSDPEFVTIEGPATGTWIVGMGEGLSFNLVLEMNAENILRGMTESPRGSGEVRDGKFDPATNVVTFTVVSEHAGVVEFSATIEGDVMTGTMSMPDVFSRQFTGARTK